MQIRILGLMGFEPKLKVLIKKFQKIGYDR